ncbi:uncharacterized protein LOC114754634 [Neltuma alba]|uniref:uncharacterized protein LOC114754634 n=1 Tax=Neltuma alba TaxID=207710 RepID=UPI0010A397C6|nr:uncharacterized protein LOC114754634 [Prosopis alba]
MSTNNSSSSSGASQQESPEEKLFIALMREEWNNVVKIFGHHPLIHDKKMGNMMKATNERADSRYDEFLSDTVLHWAITNEAPEFIVEELVDAIVETDNNNSNALETLKAKNSRGDTPLHCAATRGSLAICRRITHVNGSLVCERNNEGETPLFLAALLGHQPAFLFLHSVCKEKEPLLPSSMWKRTNGDTILHGTIRRKHFDLSYRIIELYKDQKIGSSFNTEGHLPLNELVMIPSAFKNGILLRCRQKLLYHCHLGKLNENHVCRLMDELIRQDPWYRENEKAKDMKNIVNMKFYPLMDMIIQEGRIKRSTALLIAAQNGLTEQVKKILDDIPVSIHDQLLEEKKNIVHVAIEERQSHVLEEVKKRKHWLVLREKLDVDGNNALHLAAKQSKYTARGIRGSVMQMQWEVMWFEYVKENMPPYFISQPNKKGETPGEIFTNEHMKLINECNDSVKDTCTSYIVAATFVTGSAFSACFQDIDGFGHTFSICVLISFLSSMSSLATFLAIYLSRKVQPRGFRRSLPLKLCLGIISFLASLVSMLVSFYAALSHDFEPKEKYKPIISYGIILLPVALVYAFAQFPLYWHVLKFSLTKVPNPRIVEEDNISLFFQDLRIEQQDHNQPNI